MTSVPLDGIALALFGRLPKNADKSYSYLLVRLLTGSASLHIASSRFQQGSDYSIVPPVLSTAPGGAVKHFLSAYSVGGTVSHFIKVTIGSNRNFYGCRSETDCIERIPGRVRIPHYAASAKPGCS